MADTAIEWADAVWNPTTGCDKVSPGCDNCYALTMAKRLKAMGQSKYQTDGDPRTSGPGFGLAVHEDALSIPLKWRKPRRVFVNSMSDLFHPKVPDEFIVRVFGVMGRADRHTFQVLTKRPKRMRSLLVQDAFRNQALYHASRDGRPTDRAWPLPNVWLGTSVEDQQRADERIPELLKIPAHVRFLSCEPLLGPVDLSLWCSGEESGGNHPGDWWHVPAYNCGLHWVIVGGESGHGARPMHPQWARHLRDQCVDAGVPFFFKQWGAWVDVDQAPDDTYRDVDAAHNLAGNPQRMWCVGKEAAGRLLDGRTWDQFPEAEAADG